VDGTIEEIGGQAVLRFERRFAHPVERVWDALTSPGQIIAWMGDGDIQLELVEGGRFEMRTTGPPELVDAIIEVGGEDALLRRDTVLRVEPGHVFEHTFYGTSSIVRWELRPDEDGCVLLLTHTQPSGAGRGALAGWHTLLDLLGHALDGEPVAWSRRLWEGYRDRYEVRTGR
jgi:uncharacterized protein YndB with AHSA1/START domain